MYTNYMTRLFFQWILATLSVGVAAYVVPGVHTTIVPMFIFAVVLAVINLLVRPIISIIALPLTFITLGFFALVINAGLVLLAAYIVPGFSIAGFWQAFIFSIILSLINMLFGVRFLKR